MVAPGTTCHVTEKKPPPPPPRDGDEDVVDGVNLDRFQEPPNMTTIDLTGNESGKVPTAVPNPEMIQAKYLRKLMLVLSSVVMVVLLVTVTTVLDREFHPDTPDRDDIARKLLRQKIQSGSYLAVHGDLCVLEQSHEQCCQIFQKTDLHWLMDHCTVQDVLDVIQERRHKRQLDVVQSFLPDYAKSDILDHVTLAPPQSMAPRGANSDDFRPKTKMDDIMQPAQQQQLAPCFYPYQSMMMMPGLDSGYLKVVVPNHPTPMRMPQFNPGMFQAPYQQPWMMGPMVQPAPPPPIQVQNSAGQFYTCQPTTGSSSGSSVVGVEIRRAAAGNLQDLLDNYQDRTNLSRSANILDCPKHQRACADASACIRLGQWCDNEVHCADASDERHCTCQARVGPLRHCDGYCDCPQCEDEAGCFGCQMSEFSCDDWTRYRRSTCVPLGQRCDGQKDCDLTGKDEMDCSVLTDHLGHFGQLSKVSNAVGFLHRNYQGRWYPTCVGTERWAVEVCQTEAGPSSITPRSHMMQVPLNDQYQGPYINIQGSRVSFTDTCQMGAAAFVQCPPLYCGLRYVAQNPVRRAGAVVDTSVEELLDELARGGTMSSTMRVVGGHPSQPSMWPWLVSIFKNGIFHCAGVIFQEHWILTASHCVDRYWQYHYEIQAGTLRRFSYAPTDQRRYADRVVPHERYDKENLRNDIALMRLNAPVRYNRHVRPICLPSSGTAGEAYLDGPAASTICTTVGWGATIEHGSDPDHMREVEVPILNHCKHKEDSDSEEICAGLPEGGKDACQGDSGGPLMCRNPQNPQQWYLAGIVSHGQGCARPNEPGVYTKVARYLPWILEKIGGAAIAPSRTPLTSCPGYICLGIQRCVALKRRCDGTIDCLWGDDEAGCENEVPFLKFRTNPLVGSTRTHYNTSSNFRCHQLLQVVPLSKRCNRQKDCEDGTDELNCTCADYLRGTTTRVCDSIVDCLDGTDEVDCCPHSTDVRCLNGYCLDGAKRCDGTIDCPQADDEAGCLALTDGSKLYLDHSGAPQRYHRGLVSHAQNTAWTVMCFNTSNNDNLSKVAEDVCKELGYFGYRGYHPYLVSGVDLELVKGDADDGLPPVQPHNCKDCCHALYLSCGTTLTAESERVPWAAQVYANGQFQCIGALMGTDKVVIPSSCFTPERYLTVLIGKERLLTVQSPNEQIRHVIGGEVVPDLAILQLNQTIKIDRYSQPIKLGGTTQKCFGVDVNDNQITLIPSKPCTSNLTVCRDDYWYLQAVDCRNITAQWYLPATVPPLAYAPKCSGFRCPLGECINLNQTCNGIQDCHDGTDEYPLSCSTKEQRCFHDGTDDECQCTSMELKCPTSGRCVRKSKFCDGTDDCGGGTNEEEPPVCSCGAYLTLVEPSKICDGHINCFDRSDEVNCSNCQDRFQCDSTTCVAMEMLCDGTVDCSNGADETDCIHLNTTQNAGEVWQRVGGDWYPGCFPSVVPQEDLDDICQKLQMNGTTGYRLQVKSGTTENRFRPVLDTFNTVWINTDPTNQLRFLMRSGTEPYVIQQPDDSCQPLYLACV